MLETGEMGTARDSETVIFGERIQKGATVLTLLYVLPVRKLPPHLFIYIQLLRFAIYQFRELLLSTYSVQ